MPSEQIAAVALWVRRVEGDKVGNVRRTTLSGDLMHEHHDFELDAVVHW